MTQGPAFEELGRRLRAARRRTGLAQETVSRAAGYHRVYVSMVERGKSNPTMKALLRIARVLDVDPAELVAGLHLL